MYDRRYKTIIDCSIQAGCTIIDLNGKSNKMEPKSGRIVSYKYKKHKNQHRETLVGREMPSSGR